MKDQKSECLLRRAWEAPASTFYTAVAIERITVGKALLAFAPNIHGSHMQIHSDNSITVAFMSRWGGVPGRSLSRVNRELSRGTPGLSLCGVRKGYQGYYGRFAESKTSSSKGMVTLPGGVPTAGVSVGSSTNRIFCSASKQADGNSFSPETERVF